MPNNTIEYYGATAAQSDDPYPYPSAAPSQGGAISVGSSNTPWGYVAAPTTPPLRTYGVTLVDHGYVAIRANNVYVDYSNNSLSFNRDGRMIASFNNRDWSYYVEMEDEVAPQQE